MKRNWWFILLFCIVFALPAWAENATDGKSSLSFEVGNAITFGKFTVEDTEIEVGTEAFNPRGSLEFNFGGTPFCLGIDFAISQNDFDGTYEDGEDTGKGSLDVDRDDFGAYMRLGSRESPVNLKLGYRYFKYEFSNGELDQFENGILVEWDREAEATGDLTKGIDAELNFVVGNNVQFALALGGSYFMDAKYKWSYIKTAPAEGIFDELVTGEMEMDAYSARIRPEFSFLATDNMRIFVNYTLQASIWEEDIEGTAANQYPAVDVYSAAMIGLRYKLWM